jgi:hypothetical protein
MEWFAEFVNVLLIFKANKQSRSKLEGIAVNYMYLKYFKAHFFKEDQANLVSKLVFFIGKRNFINRLVNVTWTWE